MTLAYCWAHARRKLHDIYQKDGSEIAAEGLRRIAEIYKIETKIRGTSPDQRLAIRQEQSSPLVADFRLWLTKQRSRISAVPPRRKARLYPPTLEWPANLPDRWPRRDGHQPGRKHYPAHHTQSQERSLRGHDEGGHTWARMASLIETCKLNAVDPYAYLRATLAAIANRHRRPASTTSCPGHSKSSQAENPDGCQPPLTVNHLCGHLMHASFCFIDPPCVCTFEVSI